MTNQNTQPAQPESIDPVLYGEAVGLFSQLTLDRKSSVPIISDRGRYEADFYGLVADGTEVGRLRIVKILVDGIPFDLDFNALDEHSAIIGNDPKSSLRDTMDKGGLLIGTLFIYEDSTYKEFYEPNMTSEDYNEAYKAIDPEDVGGRAVTIEFFQNQFVTTFSDNTQPPPGVAPKRTAAVVRFCDYIGIDPDLLLAVRDDPYINVKTDFDGQDIINLTEGFRRIKGENSDTIIL